MSGNQGNEEEEYNEPMSLADHQILLHSARKIINKARKYALKRTVHIKKPELRKVGDGGKIVLVPRQEGKPFKVIKLPTKVAPPYSTLTTRNLPANSQPRTSNSSLQPIEALPTSVPTRMVGVSGKSVSLTIGDKKILVRPIIKPKSIQELSADVVMSESLIRKSIDNTSKESQEKLIEQKLPQKVNNDEVPKAVFRPKMLKLQSVGPKILLRGGRVRQVLRPWQSPTPRVLARGKIIKRKVPKEFEDETNQECTKKLNPEDFPKAIVYPDVSKEKPPMKIKTVMSTSPFTFSHVFEEAAMHPQKVTINTKELRRVQPVKNIASDQSTENTNKKRNRKQEIKSIEVPEETKAKQAVESELNENSSNQHEDHGPEEQFIAVVEGDDIEMVEESNENEKSEEPRKQKETTVDKNKKSINISFPNNFARMRKRYKDELLSNDQLTSGSITNNSNLKRFNPFVNTATLSQAPKYSLVIHKRKPVEKISPPSSSSVSIENEASDEDQFEAVSPNTNCLKPSFEIDFDMPPRPEINNQLIETLTNYRVIARYLMLKKRIQPFNFDGLETEYLNVYKTLKK